MKKINCTILSFGLSGSVFHAPFIDAHPNLILHSIVERSIKKAKDKYPDIISFSNIDEAINNKEVNLVVVNTPNYTHYDFCKKSLEAGKHVLVEKPFCLNTEDAKDLFRIADEKGVKLMVYQNRRFDSEFLSIKEIVDSKVLGEIVDAHFRFDRYRPEIGNKKAKEGDLPGAGIKFDLGPHLIDTSFALFGIPQKWSLHKKIVRPNGVSDDYIDIQLDYKDGKRIYLTASMLVVKPQKAFVINGTKGTLVKDRINIQEKQILEGVSINSSEFGREKESDNAILYTFDENSQAIEKSIKAPKSNYLALFDNVYNCITNKDEYFLSREEVLKQLEILEE